MAGWGAFRRLGISPIDISLETPHLDCQILEIQYLPKTAQRAPLSDWRSRSPKLTCRTEPFMYSQILDGLGDRPLGLEADQLVIEIARWIKGRAGVGKLRLKASGISSQ